MPITGAARLAGIMGWPVAHSRSPALHGYWLAEHGVDGAYVPLAVPPDRLEQALRALPALGFRGCNLTIPHKQAALKVMDRVDPFARADRRDEHRDCRRGRQPRRQQHRMCFGFRENLKRASAGLAGARRSRAVVLGAGGSARAVIAALSAAGISEIRLVNRTVDRAETLARALAVPETRIVVHPWQARSEMLRDAGILVNTTSLGMEKEPPLDIDISPLPLSAVVVDIVYVPLETGLLAAARRRGHAAVDGLGMLLHQGRPGFAAWFGAAPQVTRELRRAMLATFAGSR